ncbi:interleukin-3 precursor [Bubalus bubalis]|uniref:Interleukin-3 n=1 Tax=Bubalus bubalis TaxID=89462 RepID=Q6Q8A8_BUBBU|nr:interleukin-3 precursor [Bubalus bubalis]AAS59069.1 interleukin-3 [Bubalus bubalis]
MSSLSISHLLLLLLALHAPQAKGLPVMTSRAPYSMLMREIMDDLKKITPSPEGSLNSDEKNFLTKESLLQANLKAFMTFATDTFGKDSKIMKNLKEFQPVLPTATPTEDPISIENKNLGDFRMKLEEYLVNIRKYLKSKNLWFS